MASSANLEMGPALLQIALGFERRHSVEAAAEVRRSGCLVPESAALVAWVQVLDAKVQEEAIQADSQVAVTAVHGLVFLEDASELQVASLL